LAVIINLIFLFFILGYLYVKKSSKYKRFSIVLFISLIVFIISFFTGELTFLRNLSRVKEPIYIIYNATLALEPDYDTFDISDSHRIAIRLSTGGEAINAAGVVLDYDPKLIEVEQIITENSFCRQDLFVERKIDNKNGEVRLSCGLPSPGFKDPKGIVAELIIRFRQMGLASLRFGDDTQVLANDGFGTNVLRTVTNGSYYITSRESQLTAENLGQLFVFSPSHPNSERWYSEKDVILVWLGISGYEYEYLFDDIPDSVPNGEYTTTEKDIHFQAEKDGIYYFHILAKKKGRASPVSHYKIMIDTTPPLGPIIKTSSKNINAGEVVRMAFYSEDKLSGLQSNFYIDFGNGLFLPVSSPLYIPFLQTGTHNLKVRVFDRAGNFSDALVSIKAQKGLPYNWFNFLLNP
jgi:hypothetical protein